MNTPATADDPEINSMFGFDVCKAFKNGIQVYSYDTILHDCPFTIANKSHTNRQIGLFPNPSDKGFHILGEGIFHTRIYSIEGKLIQAKEGEEVQTSDVPNGIYFLHIWCGKNLMKVQKLVVEHAAVH